MKTKSWKKYTAADEQFISDHYLKDMTCKQIAAVLGHTEDAIQHKAALLGLTKQVWTSHDTQFLIENYATMDFQQMINYLGKDYKCVTAKASRLGLKRGAKQSHGLTVGMAPTTRMTDATVKRMAEHSVQTGQKIQVQIDPHNKISIPAGTAPEMIQKIINRYKATA